MLGSAHRVARGDRLGRAPARVGSHMNGSANRDTDVLI